MSSLWCAYLSTLYFFFFFFNDTATTEIYPLSLHDALPISRLVRIARHGEESPGSVYPVSGRFLAQSRQLPGTPWTITDRKSTRLNSSHLVISYAVFCLKKKKNAVHHQYTVLSQSHLLVLYV